MVKFNGKNQIMTMFLFFGCGVRPNAAHAMGRVGPWKICGRVVPGLVDLTLSGALLRSLIQARYVLVD